MIRKSPKNLAMDVWNEKWGREMLRNLDLKVQEKSRPLMLGKTVYSEFCIVAVKK